MFSAELRLETVAYLKLFFYQLYRYKDKTHFNLLAVQELFLRKYFIV